MKDTSDQVEDKKQGNRPIISETMASNAWVVHGDHTVTGMPMLSSDPHQMADVPAIWQIIVLELNNGEQVLSGASFPPAPAIIFGRTKDLSWGLTTPRADTSDLWQE